MISAGPAELYLDLIKQTLTYALWPEPPLPLGSRGFSGPYLARRAAGLLSQTLGALGLQLVRPRTITPDQRTMGGYWPAYAHTMIGRRRLDDLQFCVETVLREGIAGDTFLRNNSIDRSVKSVGPAEGARRRRMAGMAK